MKRRTLAELAAEFAAAPLLLVPFSDGAECDGVVYLAPVEIPARDREKVTGGIVTIGWLRVFLIAAGIWWTMKGGAQ